MIHVKAEKSLHKKSVSCKERQRAARLPKKHCGHAQGLWSNLSLVSSQSCPKTEKWERRNRLNFGIAHAGPFVMPQSLSTTSSPSPAKVQP